MFKGSFVALVTPFVDGAIDQTGFRDFVEWQIAEGSHGLVPVGTTGETPTLSHGEHKRILELCVEQTRRRVPVIAGAGSNNTAEALDFARHAEQVGADGLLIVTPYYNKPTQEGLFQHYKTIHDQTALPIVIYNIPGRSVIDMGVETMARLAELPRIVGVKDATNDLARPLRVRTEIGPGFCQLSGEDATVAAFLAQGGHGCISVTANVAPRACADLHEAFQAGDWSRFGDLRDRLGPLHRALFLESSPAPVKFALSLLGKGNGDVRLPLVPVGAGTRAAVRDAMVHAGLLN